MNKYEDIITSCNGLIYAIINKYFKNYDKEDLYQEGVKGVIKAYNNYKDNKNTKFSTYAYKYIYGEIYSYVYNSRNIKLVRDYYKLYKKINEAKIILSQKLMKEPSNEEIAMFIEIDKKIIDEVMLAMNPVDSLDRIIYTDSKDLLLSDTIGDQKDYYNIDNIMLYDMINKLPSPDKEIIYLRYFEDKTQTEIASILKMNQVAVSRGEGKALKKIKSNYQNVA